MRKVELLPTRDCEAGYGPELLAKFAKNLNQNAESSCNISGIL